MYINLATLKKFIELIKNKKVDEKSVSLPIKPMYKVAYLNPQVTVGITGLRHIQKAGGLSTWLVIYMKKEHVRKIDSKNCSLLKPHLFQYNENNQQYSTKIMKIQVPLRGLEEITKAFMELCFGINKNYPKFSNESRWLLRTYIYFKITKMRIL